MGILFNMVKNMTVGAVKSASDLTTAVKGELEEQFDRAKIQALEKKYSEYKNMTDHYSDEEKKQIDAKAKEKAMDDIAERSAESLNELTRLKKKWNM